MMKKATKIWLIVATSLVLAGLLLFVGIMTALGWNFAKLSTVKYEISEYEIRETYQNISIKTDTADVVFLSSKSGKTSIVCYEAVKEKHRIEVRDGTLFIELVDTRQWYDYIGNIGINFGSPKITVYLPQGECGTLTLKGSTGDIEIPGELAFESMNIAVSTGDVTCKASASGAVKIKAGTGDIQVVNVTAEKLTLTVSTGKITASGIAVAGDVAVNVSTGKSYLTDVTCKNFTSTGNTGDITMKNVIAEEKMSIERSTGDVKFDRCDAAEINVFTDTGDVTGTLCSEKIFIPNSDTGDIRVPESRTGGICKITTDTGHIRISYAK